ncbi:MAG TPA: cytochrome c oxidase assembly protein [Stellaceae bacterium]|jgi:putative membrane protein|nr:cytochrome c oxidase assembly protein [Stellaceae bacterium]
MRPEAVHIPYCGLPPSPAELWSRWNLDPVLIAILVVIALAYVIAASAAKRHDAVNIRNIAAFLMGWLVLSAALISPLCPLSVSLFAARVGQHMIIVLVAIPLIAVGRPGAVARAVLGRGRAATPEASNFLNAVGASAAFAVALWFWHMPGPYAATFASNIVYWAMHITMILSALWLWAVLLDRERTRAVSVIATGLVASTQMSLLGATITFASHPLYTPHATTTAAWGLSQLLDQQLGGAIMWVPGGAIFLIAAMTSLWALVTSRQTTLRVGAR